ncbi:MAG TPA: radical SAM protein [Candidatus Hydrogenedentes bacterium]|nr:radical SAM protein [Candidatus Hydrogenedentota bacterium]HPG66933.1 radical SAM protein [Candidatus Hydrogenedentota bacterium]
MPDVVLINPQTDFDIRNVTTRLPLAMLYIGSALGREGFSVRIVDARVDPRWQETLRQSLESPVLWAGITSMSGGQIRWGLKAAQIVRDANPAVPIVWGGVHPSILPEQTLADPLVDLVCVGEGEITAVELAHRLRRDGPCADLRDIPGLVWQRDGSVVRNAPRPPMNMDDLPPIDYGLVDIAPYILAEGPGQRSLVLTTSRGCPMRCGYCYLGVLPEGRRYRAESPERVVDRLEELSRRFGIHTFHIMDDEFFTQIQRARGVCEIILERRLEFRLRAACRIDYVNRMDRETLDLFRNAGFEHLFLGAESGSDRVLEFIQKGITRADIVEANRRLREARIAPKFSFMGGFPSESLDEVKATLRLMVELVVDNANAYCTPIQLYSPYPGTPLFEFCVEQGMDAPKSLEAWSDWSWEAINFSRLTPAEDEALKRIAIFSFFIDGKTVPENAAGNPLMAAVARIYGAYIRARVRTGCYACMPEVALIKSAMDRTRRRIRGL